MWAKSAFKKNRFKILRKKSTYYGNSLKMTFFHIFKHKVVNV